MENVKVSEHFLHKMIDFNDYNDYENLLSPSLAN